MLLGLILFHGLFFGNVSLWKVGRILAGYHLEDTSVVGFRRLFLVENGEPSIGSILSDNG